MDSIMDDGLRLEEHTHTAEIKLNLLTLSEFHSNQLCQGGEARIAESHGKYLV